MLAKLTRITQNGHTRTDEVVGHCLGPPEVGKSFVIANEQPLDRSNGEDMRMVRTTPVVWTETRFGGGINFRTMNTMYLFEELTEA